MKTSTQVKRVPFNEVHTLFAAGSKQLMHLRPDTGNGVLQVFRLEKGLQARVWNCTFNKGCELHCEAGTENKNAHFTLAYFLDMQGLQLAHTNKRYHINTTWDYIFIPPVTTFKIEITPESKVLCLSISFSLQWLNDNVLNGDIANKSAWENIFNSAATSPVECMNASEKKLVQALINYQLHNTWTKLYIKSGALQLISDFISKLREKNNSFTSDDKLEGLLTVVERLLCTHVTGSMPDLKQLACKYGLSEVTLKRHFKHKHGVSMFTYFIRKKMEYAQHLLLEQNMKVSDIAYRLGYKNVHHFTTMLYKHNVINNINDQHFESLSKSHSGNAIPTA